MYNQGNLIGESVYYLNGNPCRQVSYPSCNSMAVTAWYECGAPQWREEYENGCLMSGEYYNPDNLIETQVVQGNGLRTMRDAHGQHLSVDTVHDGQMELRTTYHSNGAPAAIAPYANEKIEGKRRTFHPGGEPATIENVVNGISMALRKCLSMAS